MNIIVMAMSTLTLPNTTDISKRILKPSKYRNGKGKEEIEYYSQMEPACRKVLEENPDDYRFLILATEATLEEKIFRYQDETLKISAVNFFSEKNGAEELQRRK